MLVGDYVKAEPLLEQAIETRTKMLGPENADTAESISNLATLYEARGQYKKVNHCIKMPCEFGQNRLVQRTPILAGFLTTWGSFMKISANTQKPSHSIEMHSKCGLKRSVRSIH